MENFYIKATEDTPEIVFNIDGSLYIKGKSYPENTFGFYKPVKKWINDFIKDDFENLTFNIELIYCNSHTSMIIFDLLELLEKQNNDTKIEINWICHKENDSMLDMGEDMISEFKNLNINLVDQK